MLKYSLLFFTYILIGSVVFMALENNGGSTEETRRKHNLQQSLKAKMKSTYNVSGAEFDALSRDFVDAYSNLKEATWDFNRGFVFVIQLVTTIGYGNIVPVTQGGRLFSIVYAFFGLIITLLTLQVFGYNMCGVQRKLITKLEKTCLKKVDTPQNLPEKCLLTSASLSVILILIGAMTEVISTSGTQNAWSFVDGIYVWFITFTTIGFGDLVPDNQLPQWFVSLYTLIGLCTMSSLLHSLTDCPRFRQMSLMKTCALSCVQKKVETVLPASCQEPNGNPNVDGEKSEVIGPEEITRETSEETTKNVM